MAPTPTLSRLLRLARPERTRILLALTALVVSSAFTLAYPLVVQRLIDSISGDGGDAGVVDRSAILLLVLFLLGSLAGGLRAWLFTDAGERIVARLRTDLYAALLGQELAFFDKQRTGELTSRLASDTTVIQNTVTVNLSMLLRFSVMGVGAVALLFFTSWRLTLLTLAIVPVAVGLARLAGQRMKALARDSQDALAASATVAEEALSGMKTVRLFAQERRESARYAAAVDASYRVARKRTGLSALFQGVGGFAGYAVIALVLWYGGKLLQAGQLSLGELTSYLLYTLTGAFSLGALSSLYEDFMKALGASSRVFELLDRVPEMRSGSVAPGDPPLALEHVSFAYPSRPSEPVLHDVSLVLEPGRVVALVGPSGSGKSTISALASRLYDPTAGQLTLGGVPYPSMDLDALRRKVGVVSQEPLLFALSIRDNIRYGAEGASDAAVEAAARAANAHDFIQRMENGYETLVGERGAQLSGGQKQRVAIARALLLDPAILILDEATSALDSESERLVQEALDRLMVGRTTLVIAHRLSTVRHADEIVVMDRGRIAERGTHDALLTRGGLYRHLVEHQLTNTSATA